MSREEYNFRNTTTSIDDANSIVQQLGCRNIVAIMLKMYDIKDKTRTEYLGERRGKGRSKKVKSALLI